VDLAVSVKYSGETSRLEGEKSDGSSNTTRLVRERWRYLGTYFSGLGCMGWADVEIRVPRVGGSNRWRIIVIVIIRNK
jgi:hypothetical protein